MNPMFAVAASAGPAAAQDYVFPASPEDYPEFAPTAYYDHFGGYDFTCGTYTYDGHLGSDFGAGGFPGMDEGRTITAAADGVVAAINDGEFDRCTSGSCGGGAGFGNYVKLDHADGKSTIYGHLKQWSVAVAVGDPVVCGQPLGEMGSSGNSTGPHVHFEVRNVEGLSEDPFEGACSAPPTYWVDQGAYRELPVSGCDEHPPCTSISALTCGDRRAGDTSSADASVATWSYGCSGWVYSGPEQVYTFVADDDQLVNMELTDLVDDLDLIVLRSSTCDGTGCVADSVSPYTADEGVSFVATTGAAYTVVVDGWRGARGAYTLDVTCLELDPATDTSPTPPGATADTAERPPADPPPAPPSRCGCGPGFPRTGSPWLVLAALHRRRRRVS